MISLSKTIQGDYLPFCGDSSNDVFTILFIIGKSSEKKIGRKLVIRPTT